jgi:hypothetical protein
MPAIKPRAYKDQQREFHELLTQLAELAWLEYCRNPYRSLYIVGQRKTGIDTHNPAAFIWTGFSIADDYEVEKRRDEGWLVVHGEALPRSGTVDVIRGKIETVMRREPMYIFAD